METEYKNVVKGNNTSWKPFFRQLLVVSVLWSSYVVGGMSMGSPTVVVPQLRRAANSTDAVSSEMASWLTSIVGYAATVWVCIMIPIGHFCGRRWIMIVVSLCTLISSAMIFVSKTAVHFLISQIVNSATFAAQISMVLLIMSEYSAPKYRGVFLTFKSASYFWGMWIANAIGIFTHYKYIGLVGMSFSSISFIISLTLPESPYWLAFKGRYDECAIAHRWLKGVSEDSERELDDLIQSQKQAYKSDKAKTSVKKYFDTYLMTIRRPDIYKPLLLCCLIFSLYHCSGKFVCSVYAIEMMKKIIGNSSAVNSGVLILDGFTVLGMYIGCGFSKILKRRTLLLTTAVTGTTFIYIMCIYLYLVKLSLLPENSYIIITMLAGYSLAISSGPLILASSIPAELLPMKHRSICILIFSISCTMMTGTIVKVSPYVFNSAGFHGAFFGFGVCSTILIILIYKYVPETKDKTLHEIAAIFKMKEPDKATKLKLLSCRN